MPNALSAADFLSLRLQYKNTQTENELPAVIEHDFKDGRMSDHYFVVPGPAFFADEAVQGLGGVQNILFLQQPDGGPWHVLLHDPTMTKEVIFEMPCEEFTAMLTAYGIILPGEPGFVMP